MSLREVTHASQPRTGPVHLYLPKSLFEEVVAEDGSNNKPPTFLDHSGTHLVEFYDTATYRFSCYITKAAGAGGLEVVGDKEGYSL